MRVIGNILWIVLGGLLIAVGWVVIGLVLCVTIVGIPLGVQAQDGGTHPDAIR